MTIGFLYEDIYTDNFFQHSFLSFKISRGNYVTVVLLNHMPYVKLLDPIATSLQDVTPFFLA